MAPGCSTRRWARLTPRWSSRTGSVATGLPGGISPPDSLGATALSIGISVVMAAAGLPRTQHACRSKIWLTIEAGLRPARSRAPGHHCTLDGRSGRSRIPRQNPDGVAALIVMCGTFGRITTTFHGTDLLDQVLPGLVRGMRMFPGMAVPSGGACLRQWPFDLLASAVSWTASASEEKTFNATGSMPL